MRYLLAVVSGQLPPEEIDPRLGLGFGSRSGLALGLGAIYVSSIYVAELCGILSSFVILPKLLHSSILNRPPKII